MKSNQTFSILFWINKKKGSKGYAPIWVRITIDGVRAECSIQRKVLIDSWDTTMGKVKVEDRGHAAINNYLDIVRADIVKHYNILLATGSNITAETLKNSFKGVSEKKKTLLDFFDAYLKKRKEEVEIGELADGTYNRFKVTKEKCANFLKKELKKADIFLEDLKLNFIEDFEHYLKYKEGIGHNTANKYAKNVKQVIKKAVGKEYLSKNPFENFKCTFRKVHRDFLEEDELQQLIAKEIKIRRLDEVRDVYVFACYTGYSFEELSSLTLDNIVRRIDGEKWIMKDRDKTDEKENVPLLPIPEQIIEKYKNYPYCVVNNKIIPIKSNQKYNAYLKELADLCGINKELTTHTARHTFATTVTLANDVPLETVSEMLGHQDIRTTKIYAKMVQRKIGNDMRKLKEKLSQSDNKSKKIG
jgi:site-specific recombinase XerD